MDKIGMLEPIKNIKIPETVHPEDAAFNILSALLVDPKLGPNTKCKKVRKVKDVRTIWHYPSHAIVFIEDNHYWKGAPERKHDRRRNQKNHK